MKSFFSRFALLEFVFQYILTRFFWDSQISVRCNWAQKYSIRLTVTEKNQDMLFIAKSCVILVYDSDCFHNAYRVLFGLFSLIWVLLHHHICVDKLCGLAAKWACVSLWLTENKNKPRRFFWRGFCNQLWSRSHFNRLLLTCRPLSR